MSVNETIKFAARGRASYYATRERIAKELVRNPGQKYIRPNSYLRSEFYDIKKINWTALAFDKIDWKIIDDLLNNGGVSSDLFYTNILTDYIEANSDAVKRVYDCNLKMSERLMFDSSEEDITAFENLNAQDYQSLFMFRTISAESRQSTDELISYFKNNFKTDWLQKRFLYPLIYHALNNPRDDYLDTFLSYVVTGREDGSEKLTIKFLLRDDLCYYLPLRVKLYIALICHPYDAYDIFLNHIEMAIAAKGAIDRPLTEALSRLAESVPTARAKALLSLVRKEFGASSREIARKTLTEDFKFSEPVAEFIIRFVDLESGTIDQSDAPPLLRHLERMRINRYPERREFDYIVPTAQGWRFIEGGRLLNSLITSLYLIPRREFALEVRDLLALQGFLGGVSGFLLASPSGAEAIRQGRFDSTVAAEVSEYCDLVLAEGGEVSDRRWIKAVQWQLRHAEQANKISEWLDRVYSGIRVAPAYLTGIDWSFIDNALATMRLLPFYGKENGVYALMLRQIESPDQDLTDLRTAFEPFVTGKSLPEIVSWLTEHFGAEATAFVRYLMTPEALLLLRLAPNETAALAGRISALERCVKEFGFSQLMDEPLYQQETKALTSALLLRNVNAGQFEIPWGAFKRDTQAKQRDLHAAYTTLSINTEAEPLLSRARVSTPRRFLNGQVETFGFMSLEWPLIELIIAVIEDFLQHPAFGLEVLLSTRFRHDTLKREVVLGINSINDQMIQGVTDLVLRELTKRAANAIGRDVEVWADRRMQSSRSARPEGLFNLVPSQSELQGLFHDCATANTIEEIIEAVCGWLRNTLDAQLANAKSVFKEELGATLKQTLASQRETLMADGGYRASDVQKVYAALDTAADRRIHDLQEWFKGVDGEQRLALSFEEVKIAADGLFEAAIDDDRFRAKFSGSALRAREVLPEKVRLCFDLVSEIFSNAIKHSGKERCRIRIRSIEKPKYSGFVFSNLTSEKIDKSHVAIKGSRYISESDAIFREGNSGLKKIAALSATLIEREATVHIVNGRRGFHILVPVWAGEINLQRGDN